MWCSTSKWGTLQVKSYFPTLKWHFIFENQSRHSNFTIEKDRKVIFSLLFPERFHLYLSKAKAKSSLRYAAAHILSFLFRSFLLRPKLQLCGLLAAHKSWRQCNFTKLWLAVKGLLKTGFSRNCSFKGIRPVHLPISAFHKRPLIYHIRGISLKAL